MHLKRTGVLSDEMTATESECANAKPTRGVPRRGGERLRAIAGVLLTLAATMPAYGQQAGTVTTTPNNAASELPVAPAPVATQPYPLRTSNRDYSKAFANWFGDPIKIIMPTNIPKASFENSVRLADLVKDGKIYLSLSDALALAIENNYDIAISRYNLDIADTDILRAKSGAPILFGVPSGLVTGTLGGSTSTLSTGGGPGGTTVGSGGAGSGASGLSERRTERDPTRRFSIPRFSGTIQLQRAESPRAEHFPAACFDEYERIQLCLQPGIRDGHSAASGLQQSAHHDKQLL